MPRLITTDGAGTVTEHEIGVGSLKIGRSSHCDVVVLEEAVSRRHAVLEYDGETLRLRDEDSNNGTWVNGERVEEKELSEGDEIRIGETRLKVVLVEAAPAAPAAREVLERPGETESVDQEDPTKAEAAWEVGAAEKEAKKEAKKEVKKKERKAREEKKGKKARKGKRPKKRSPEDISARDTVDLPSPGAKGAAKTTRPGRDSDAVRTPRRKREILGGMRLSAQQQLIVKIASFVVIIICLFGIAWLLNILTSRPYERGRRIVRDPRAAPERLAEEAVNLARQAQEAEDRRETREAFRLVCEAKQKIEEADRLYTELAQKYEGKGYTYVQKMARKIKWRTKAIREQHFRLDMQLRREDGRL